jgi:hypothetical protein
MKDMPASAGRHAKSSKSAGMPLSEKLKPTIGKVILGIAIVKCVTYARTHQPHEDFGKFILPRRKAVNQ